MTQLAQIGIGAASAGLQTLYIITFLLGLALPALVSLLWYAPECYQLMKDLLTRRNLFEEFKRDQRLEGRLFDPGYVQRDQRSTLTSDED